MGTVSSREGTDSPLIAAAKSGDALAAAQLLRTPGTDVNHRGVQKWTPLMVSLYNSNVQVSRLLLQHPEVDVNARDKLGWTPLMRVANGGSIVMVQMLLQHPGVVVNAHSPQGLTALTESAFGGFAGVVQSLLKHPDIRVNCADQNGSTALMKAASRGGQGNAAVLRLLLERPELHVNARDKEGNTALMIAVKGNHIENVSALLEHRGVDVGLKNKAGKSALGLSRNKQISSMLQDASSDLSRKATALAATSSASTASIPGELFHSFTSAGEPSPVQVHETMGSGSEMPPEDEPVDSEEEELIGMGLAQQQLRRRRQSPGCDP
ncbi:ankyrin repeat-containing domain protein [Dunaliella salina]|uniref:Ankyrin repeat-containing domain protein n=1 Tax=Dunaliella salina TaxID=3046 RepID=A0ABQ7G4J7_DUNSA|nr:ankyrin repeat-containing domain protein [Dunaliella salina]|eukprot:KAF5829525.1 ankyrin repeat-containing domain protein [Dunaliella salina]